MSCLNVIFMVFEKALLSLFDGSLILMYWLSTSATTKC